MIPKIIHYVWLGGSPMLEDLKTNIHQWQQLMPEWQIMPWTSITIAQTWGGNWLSTMPLYVRQAYEAHQWAFVSDYIRLLALERFGGVYIDVDFHVYRPLDDLCERYDAFAGLEGSKTHPVMMGLIASRPHGEWVSEMITYYHDRPFLLEDGTMDLLPNTSFLSDRMTEHGFTRDARTQMYKDLTILPEEYFCPRNTMGEYHRTELTYAESTNLGSWAPAPHGLKAWLMRWLPERWCTALIKLKRRVVESASPK